MDQLEQSIVRLFAFCILEIGKATIIVINTINYDNPNRRTNVKRLNNNYDNFDAQFLPQSTTTINAFLTKELS
jgi:ribosome-binding ATPase YchF (GTP1/OBG family)